MLDNRTDAQMGKMTDRQTDRVIFCYASPHCLFPDMNIEAQLENRVKLKNKQSFDISKKPHAPA